MYHLRVPNTFTMICAPNIAIFIYIDVSFSISFLENSYYMTSTSFMIPYEDQPVSSRNEGIAYWYQYKEIGAVFLLMHDHVLGE